MAQHSGFFNALMTQGEYDRNYNADDYSNNLAVVISDGVLRSANDDLKAITDGMNVTIGIGRGWIRGRWFYNDTPYNFVVPAASTVYPRKDRICLRLDNTLATRNVFLYYASGVPAEIPVAPAPVDTEDVKDLVLCEIDVPKMATSVTVKDTRADASLCGWVYSTSGDNSFFTSLDSDFNEWLNEKKETLATVTIFKQYLWQGVTDTDGQDVVTFDIPQYDPTGVDIIQVYTNGLLEVEGTDYTLDGSNIHFIGNKAAGQEITVICYKSIDGTGLGSMSDRLEEAERKIAALDDFTAYNYICTGVNDNIELSKIALNFVNSADDGKTMTIYVHGNIGISTPFGGVGDTLEPFRWFSFGTTANTSRRICFDFGNCSQLNIPLTANTQNIIFYGTNVYVRNAKIRAEGTGASTTCIGFNSTSGNVLCERCVFNILGGTGSYLSATGVFRDCSVAVHNSAGVGRCFIPTTASFLKITGGDYRAYAASGRGSAAIYVASTMTDAVVITEAVSFPNVSRTGYTLEYAIYDLANSKKCLYIGTVTPLTVSATGQTVYNTIVSNKTTGVW